MAMMGVVFHNVPKDRAVPNIHHRLGNRVGELAHAHSESTTEKNHFHRSSSFWLKSEA